MFYCKDSHEKSDGLLRIFKNKVLFLLFLLPLVSFGAPKRGGKALSEAKVSFLILNEECLHHIYDLLKSETFHVLYGMSKDIANSHMNRNFLRSSYAKENFSRCPIS